MVLKKLPIKKLSEFERGYLSASIDTDGSVFIIKIKNSTYQGRVEVYNTNYKYLEKIRDMIGGGAINKLKFIEGRKQPYKYYIPALCHEWLLPQLKLVIKQEKLNYVIKLNKILRSRRGRGRVKNTFIEDTNNELNNIYKRYKTL